MSLQKKNLDRKWPLKTLPSFEQWQWGAAIIDSRGLRFRSKVHLAPFADMFNYGAHSAPREVRILYIYIL